MLEDGSIIIIDEIRIVKDGNIGHILFQIGVDCKYGMSIIIKPKGVKQTYIIPIELFIEPFVRDMDLFKERCREYWEKVQNQSEEK